MLVVVRAIALIKTGFRFQGCYLARAANFLAGMVLVAKLFSAVFAGVVVRFDAAVRVSRFIFVSKPGAEREGPLLEVLIGS